MLLLFFRCSFTKVSHALSSMDAESKVFWKSSESYKERPSQWESLPNRGHFRGLVLLQMWLPWVRVLVEWLSWEVPKSRGGISLENWASEDFCFLSYIIIRPKYTLLNDERFQIVLVPGYMGTTDIPSNMMGCLPTNLGRLTASSLLITGRMWRKGVNGNYVCSCVHWPWYVSTSTDGGIT